MEKHCSCCYVLVKILAIMPVNHCVFITLSLCLLGTGDMDASQASDVEDWERIKRDMVSMDALMTSSSAPQAKKTKAS